MVSSFLQRPPSISGLTAMPGALPTIWCDLNGVPNAQQRTSCKSIAASFGSGRFQIDNIDCKRQ
jgi:hypothetical protein